MTELGIALSLAFVFGGTLFLALRVPRLALPLLVALAARLAVAWAGVYAVILPYSTADAVRFERIAWGYAQGGWSTIRDTFDPTGSGVISSVYAVQYLLFGRNPWMPLLLNILLSTMTVWLIYLAARELWGADRAVLAAWAWALFPSGILLSAVILREAAIVFCMVAGAFFLLRFQRGGAWFHLLGGAVAFASAAMFHGAMALVGLAWIAILALADIGRVVQRTGLQRSALRVVAVAGILALSVGAWFQAGHVELGSVGLIDAQEMTDELIVESRRVERGGSDYLVGLSTPDLRSALTQTPLRIAYFTFSPLPWQVRTPTQLLGLFDSILIFLLIVAAWNGRRELLRDRRVVVLLVALTIGVLLFAFGTSNAGTALRHRGKFVPLLILLATPGLWRVGLRMGFPSGSGTPVEPPPVRRVPATTHGAARDA